MSDSGVVRAAGAVLWRGDPADPEIALVHRQRHQDWSLPKGKVDPGEHPVQTAVREVAEETGMHGHLGRRLRGADYAVTVGGESVPKHVDYWELQASSGAFEPNSEVDEVRWLPVAAATEQLTYAHDADVLASFTALPAATHRVLLVRHAHAGDRSGWDGPDLARPLSAVGRAQADRLVELLLPYGPARVAAADPLRCVQTLRPLAERLGVPLEAEPALSETAVDEDVDRALDRVLALAGGPTTAACSQGGPIPLLLARLHRKSSKDGRRWKTRKAGTWVLSFADSRLVNADYVEDSSTSAAD